MGAQQAGDDGGLATAYSSTLQLSMAEGLACGLEADFRW